VAAVILALLMRVGGGGHTAAVVGRELRSGRPYGFRFAALLTNGAILLYGGMSQLALTRAETCGAVPV
jgi:hypothetical protein